MVLEFMEIEQALKEKRSAQMPSISVGSSDGAISISLPRIPDRFGDYVENLVLGASNPSAIMAMPKDCCQRAFEANIEEWAKRLNVPQDIYEARSEPLKSAFKNNEFPDFSILHLLDHLTGLEKRRIRDATERFYRRWFGPEQPNLKKLVRGWISDAQPAQTCLNAMLVSPQAAPAQSRSTEPTSLEDPSVFYREFDSLVDAGQDATISKVLKGFNSPRYLEFLAVAWKDHLDNELGWVDTSIYWPYQASGNPKQMVQRNAGALQLLDRRTNLAQDVVEGIRKQLVEELVRYLSSLSQAEKPQVLPEVKIFAKNLRKVEGVDTDSQILVIAEIGVTVKDSELLTLALKDAMAKLESKQFRAALRILRVLSRRMTGAGQVSLPDFGKSLAEVVYGMCETIHSNGGSDVGSAESLEIAIEIELAQGTATWALAKVNDAVRNAGEFDKATLSRILRRVSANIDRLPSDMIVALRESTQIGIAALGAGPVEIGPQRPPVNAGITEFRASLGELDMQLAMHLGVHSRCNLISARFNAKAGKGE